MEATKIVDFTVYHIFPLNHHLINILLSIHFNICPPFYKFPGWLLESKIWLKYIPFLPIVLKALNTTICFNKNRKYDEPYQVNVPYLLSRIKKFQFLKHYLKNNFQKNLYAVLNVNYTPYSLFSLKISFPLTLQSGHGNLKVVIILVNICIVYADN